MAIKDLLVSARTRILEFKRSHNKLVKGIESGEIGGGTKLYKHSFGLDNVGSGGVSLSIITTELTPYTGTLANVLSNISRNSVIIGSISSSGGGQPILPINGILFYNSSVLYGISTITTATQSTNEIVSYYMPSSPYSEITINRDIVTEL